MAATVLAGALAIVCLTGPVGAQTISVPRGGLIVAEGDSLTYGQDMVAATRPPTPGACCARASTSWPEVLAQKLGVTVENRGFPGDRTVDGLLRWQGKPAGAVAILAYGANDAINAGGLALGTLTLDSFRREVEALVARRRDEGAKVLLLTPFSTVNAELDARIEPYRKVVREVGHRLRCPVLDGPAAMSLGSAGFSDGVHLNAAGYTAVGEAIARHFRVR